MYCVVGFCFLGFGLLVVWLLVSVFDVRLLASWFQTSPQKQHFVISGRYCSHIQFVKIVVVRSSSFPVPVFPKMSNAMVSIVLTCIKTLFLKLFPSAFLTFLKVLRHISIHKCGVPGSNNPEVMDFGGFGPSHNKTEISLFQNGAE